ncbi:MAG: DUF1893 domain-containing protein [Clostridia bacterium]|nr:DUF1893 domain-containing protein [Clostridia bacterium]
MTDKLKKAKTILQNGGHTCVLYNGSEILHSDTRGVAPLLGWLESDRDFSSFSAADKVIGKAAAMLYVLIGIKEVYADVISKYATDVFEKHGIEYYYTQRVDAIRNRTDTGFCPMEEATLDIDEPTDALTAIKSKLEQLKKRD